MLTGGTDGDLFEEPLGGVDRGPGASDVVEQQQPAARDQDAFHLADRRGGIGDRAQRQRADHRVERGVAGGQMLGVALLEFDLTAEAGSALAGDGEHRGAQLDPGDGRAGRVVGQVAAGADGDLQDPALRALAEPFPAATEPDLLEEGNLLVVAGRGLVPHPLLPGGGSLAGPCLGGAGHDGGPSRFAGSGKQQSASGAATAPRTPMIPCRTRPAARAGSGWPASSQAVIASMATAGGCCAAQRAGAWSGMIAEICKWAAAVMPARNFSMRAEDYGLRSAGWNSSRDQARDS